MNSSGHSPRSWKGNAKQLEVPSVHRWQTSPDEVQAAPRFSAAGPLRRTAFVMLGLSLAMLSLFIYLLLFAPTKTPFIAMAAIDYDWPMMPNAWAMEDVSAFSSLNGKTIRLTQLNGELRSKSSALEAIQAQLTGATELARKSGAIIVYVTAHGAVDDRGVASLIPTGASPVTTNQWIPIHELASSISSSVSSGVNVLLVLDCVRQRVNWHAGELNNTFCKSLASWAQTSRPKNLFVIVSTAQGEQAWSGRDLQGSIFGQQLRLGLAGAADKVSAPGEKSVGNGDGSVSLRELFDYVSTTVGTWARDMRGTTQTTEVYPKDIPNLRLVWNLQQAELNDQIATARRRELTAGTISVDELQILWRDFDALRQSAAFRYDPRGWIELERKLLWLEQLSNAGLGYEELARQQVFPELARRINQCLERVKDLRYGTNVLISAGSLAPDEQIAFPSVEPPSLALHELLGEKSVDAIGKLREQALDILESNDLQRLANLIANVSSQGTLSNELNFAGLLVKFGAVSAWPDRTVVRDALSLREQCERFAVLGDVRGHRWRRQSIESIDRVRRLFEDQILVGPVAGQKPLAEELRQAISTYDAINGKQNRIEDAWRLRDTGLAEAFYLAQWICSPDNDMSRLGEWMSSETAHALEIQNMDAMSQLDSDTSMLREKVASQILLRWINALHELGGLLVDSSTSTDQQFAVLDSAITRVSRDREALGLLVKDHLRRALAAGTTAQANVRAIDALMTLPILSTEDRLALRQKYNQSLQAGLDRQLQAIESTSTNKLDLLASKFMGKNSRDALELSSAVAETPSAADYVDRMHSWDRHPLLAILTIKEMPRETQTDQQPSSTRLDQDDRHATEFDELRELVRRHFLSVLSLDASHLLDWIRASNVDWKAGKLDEAWYVAGLAEHLERTLLPVGPIHPESDASASYRNLVLKDMLVWYANRSVDDFYADCGSQLLGDQATEAFFERAAARALEFAQLLPASTVDLQPAIKTVQDRIAILGPVARNGLKVSVKQGIPLAGSESRQFEVQLQPTIPFAKDVRLPAVKGIGVAIVRSSQGIVPGARVPISIPESRQTQSANLLCAPNEQASIETLVVFRGHEYKSPMFMGQGIEVDFVPQQFDTAEVVLFGDRRRQQSMVFILDCSSSMGDLIPVEAIDVRTASKLDLAKQHVENMISQIAASPDARLGVRLFGHRLGWSRPSAGKVGSKTTRVIAQPNYPDDIPDDIVPSTDVEAIVPLGRFSPEMIGGVSSKLSKIVPWGQSPLYYSIVQAFQDFSVDDDSTAKSIVVVTDGDNFQYNASGRSGGEKEITTSLEDVQRAWQSAKIPLFVLDVGSVESNASAARTNLQRLAENTSGKYYDIENGNDLLRALSEQLPVGNYQVARRETEGKEKATEEKLESKLNSPMKLSGLTNRSAGFSLIYQSTAKSITLEGGESLEFFLRDDGDIIAKPYDRLAPRTGTLVRSGDSNRLLARVHRPLQLQDSVTFPISIQAPASHFTARPKELWIEISPVAASTQSSRSNYLFYDANYEPGAPVPLVSWTATDWPSSASAADIRIWAKFDSTPVLQTIPLSQIRIDSDKFLAGIDVVGIEGVKLQAQIMEIQIGSARSLEVQVIELHDEQSLGVGSVRLHFESGNIAPPTRVRRRFEFDNRIAIHTFTLDASLAATYLNSPQASINVSTRAAAQDGAWHLESSQSIRVDTRKPADTLPPSTTR